MLRRILAPISVALLWVLLARVCFAAGAPAREQQTLRVSATWGQLACSQLERNDPVAFWSVQTHAPLVDAIGLAVQLRFDSPVFGDPHDPLSLIVQPGRTEYNMALRMAPPGLGFQAEFHHVSGHRVAPVQRQMGNTYEAQVKQGGASNCGSLIWALGGSDLRVGYGSLWTDTNTAPMLLGLEGILLNSRSGSGPFIALRLPAPQVWGMHGDVGVLFLKDLRGHYVHDGDSLAWGLSTVKPVSGRLGVGVSYVGNNGTPGLKRGDTTATLFVKLSWPGRKG
jgi:hypothetical protein